MEKILNYGDAIKLDIKKREIFEISVVSDVPQLSDLWARRKDNPEITYHPNLTIDNNFEGKGRLFYAKTGTVLYDSEENKIIGILDDGGFKHDLTMPGCRKSVYERHGISNKKGCRDLIAEVMEIPTSDINGTFNLFYEMDYETSGKFKTTQARSGKDAYCKFLALEDLEIAVTACPAEANVVKEGKGAIKVRLYGVNLSKVRHPKQAGSEI